MALGDELRALLPQNGTILVVGLSSSQLPRSRSGHSAAGLVLATAIFRKLAEARRKSAPHAVFIPGLGQTGLKATRW